MSSPGLRATVAIVVLVLVGIAAGALGALELAQPTSVTTTTSTSYSASLSPFLNISVRPNPLYPPTQTNPPAVFSNITTSLELSFEFDFAANQPIPVAGVLSSAATFSSGTNPSWSEQVFSSSSPLFFNSSARSGWVATPLSLSSISSLLNNSSAYDRELHLAPGAATVEVNASFDINFAGGQSAQNNTSVQLAFEYPAGQTGTTAPSAYSAIAVAYPSPGGASGEWQTPDASLLPSHTWIGEVGVSVAAAALVSAALVGALYLPRERPSPLQRFLSENGENVIRVVADTRLARKAVQVKDLAELVKLANLSGQPIFLYESPKKGALLYVIQGDTSFGCVFPSETAREGTAS